MKQKSQQAGKSVVVHFYESPTILHKGRLKQFAGSPLGDKPDGMSLLGLPGS